MLTITDDGINSDLTHHCALPVLKAVPYGQWWVSWLPDQRITRNQAITAMVLAEHVESGATTNDHPRWPFVQTWAAELDLTASAAIEHIRGGQP